VQSDRTPPPARTDEQRRARYNHLIERLRNRQITMEEATELFGLLQGYLRASEAARTAALAPPPLETRPRTAPPKPGTVPIPAADDLLAIGILAMGAGAGLLAAITKKMAETSAAGPPSGRPATRPASR
jgi:hypothetical protein